MGSSTSKVLEDHEIEQHSLKSAYSKLFTNMEEVERVKESWRMSAEVERKEKQGWQRLEDHERAAQPEKCIQNYFQMKG